MNKVYLAIVFFQCLFLGGLYYLNQTLEVSLCQQPVLSDEFKVIGHTEKIVFGKKRLTFEAKVDSGADTSSLHATNIRPFTKVIRNSGGEMKNILYVRFTTVDDRGKESHLEKLVSRIDQVRSASGVHQRYFFTEKVWIHQQEFEVEVNLADRSQLSKKFLVGKNLINQGYLIDASQSYILTTGINPALDVPPHN